MFMAILDIQIVASSLPDIQAGLGIALRSIELGADRVSDRRGRRDPADRLADPRHVDARRLSRLHLRVYRRQPGLRRVQQLLVADPGAGAAGLLRRRFDPARFLGDLSDVRGARSQPSDSRRGLVGDAGARPSDRPSAASSPTAIHGIGCS